MRLSIVFIKTRLQPVPVLLLLALLLAVPFHGLRANGWEHAAVPYELLVKALQKGQAETRARAAQSLGIRGQPEALEPLLLQLSAQEEDGQLRALTMGAPISGDDSICGVREW